MFGGYKIISTSKYMLYIFINDVPDLEQLCISYEVLQFLHMVDFVFVLD